MSRRVTCQYRLQLADLHKKVGFSAERTFKTKPEIAWEIIQRLKTKGIPFDAVAMDDLCGRNGQLRKQLGEAGIEYYGDILENMKVYLDKPQIVYPITSEASLGNTTSGHGAPQHRRLGAARAGKNREC